MPKRLTLEEVRRRFLEKGHTLISIDYKSTQQNLDYKCKCGNERICHISLASMKAGHDNCDICIHQKTVTTCKAKYGVENYSKTQECKNKVIKTCREKYGVDCYLQTQESKDKTKETYREKLGVDHHMQTQESKDLVKESCMEKYSVDHPMRSQEVKAKFTETMIERYGKAHALQVDEFKEKMKETNREKFGVEFASQNEEVQEKMKATFMTNYGVDHPLKNLDIKEQMKQTCLERYGEYYTQTEEMKEKSKQTCLEKYGVEYAMQSEKIRLKFAKTFRSRYGVDHPMHVADFVHKGHMAAFTLKEFTFENDETVFVQGYEPICLSQLLDEGITDIDILDGFETMPIIEYIFQGKDHRYYPDIYIPSKNLLIEVKSDYLYERDKQVIIAKLEACVKEGYNSELRVYTKKHELDRIIYWKALSKKVEK